MAPRTLLLAAALGCLSGCGLGEYERKMKASQARVQRFEEESRLLGEPIQVPTHLDDKNQTVPLATLFFRPPRNIRPAPDEAPRDGILYRYPAATAGPVQQVEVGFGAGRKGFAEEVFRSFGQLENIPVREKQVQTAGGQALTFDVREYDDDRHRYSIHVLRGGAVAIAYWLDKGQAAGASRAVELSLESLALDAEAGLARGRYNPRSPWKR